MKILDVADEMILAASINITDTQIFLGTTTKIIREAPQKKLFSEFFFFLERTGKYYVFKSK